MAHLCHRHRFITTHCQIHKMLEIVCKSDIMKQAGETIKDFEFADNRYGRSKAGTFNEKESGIKTVALGICHGKRYHCILESSNWNGVEHIMGIKLVNKYFDLNEKDIAEGKYSAWELIQPLWYTVSIYDGHDVYEQDLKPFTEAQRKILALFWYDSEVCNGGHDQFFFNSTGIVWKDALECMRMIGAGKYAQNFQKAVDLFGGRIPFDRSERIAALEKLREEEGFDDFEQIDSFYYDDGEDIDQLMNEYVKSHAADFVVKGEYLADDSPD